MLCLHVVFASVCSCSVSLWMMFGFGVKFVTVCVYDFVRLGKVWVPTFSFVMTNDFGAASVEADKCFLFK